MTLAYDDTGSGDAVVFLHGVTASRGHWAPAIERLADRYRCVNVDLLSHGASSDGETADLFAQVNALMALLDELGLENPVLVGHSFGAFIATFLATARPVRGVVNIDQHFDTAEFREQIEPIEAQLRGDSFDAAFAGYLMTQRPDLVPAERQDVVYDNMAPRQDVVLSVWGAVLETAPEELTAQVEAALPAVDVPYLAIFGAAISERERALQDLMPQSTVEVWDDHGHFVHLVDPTRVASRIAAFIDGLS